MATTKEEFKDIYLSAVTVHRGESYAKSIPTKYIDKSWNDYLLGLENAVTEKLEDVQNTLYITDRWKAYQMSPECLRDLCIAKIVPEDILPIRRVPKDGDEQQSEFRHLFNHGKDSPGYRGRSREVGWVFMGDSKHAFVIIGNKVYGEGEGETFEQDLT